ncbi:MAG: hypothetical protein ABI369_09105 [Acetobacteraceae bacterium]
MPLPAVPDLPSTRIWSRGLSRRAAGVAERKHAICAAAAPLFAAEGLEAISFTRLTTAAGMQPGTVANLYASCHEVLADVIDTHLLDLTREVGAAHDAAHASEMAPVRRLEVVVRAFLDAVATRPDEHRAFLFCVHALPERERESILLRYQIVLEMVRDVLVAGTHGLEADTAACETLLGTIRTMLSDPWRWPRPHGPEQRRAEARALTGMLLAMARALAAGTWPNLGGVAGADPPIRLISIDLSAARTRFSEMVKAAELGADIALTRRGRCVARVVGAG